MHTPRVAKSATDRMRAASARATNSPDLEAMSPTSARAAFAWRPRGAEGRDATGAGAQGGRAARHDCSSAGRRVDELGVAIERLGATGLLDTVGEAKRVGREARDGLGQRPGILRPAEQPVDAVADGLWQAAYGGRDDRPPVGEGSETTPDWVAERYGSTTTSDAAKRSAVAALDW